jgi:hypothetical protein
MPNGHDSFYSQIEQAAKLAPVMSAHELVTLSRKAILRLDEKDLLATGSGMKRALQVIRTELSKRGHTIGPVALYG